MNTSKKHSGFTIVELLIVIVVIAILAAITIVGYNGIRNSADRSALSSAVSQASKKVALHAVNNGDAYPDSLLTAGILNSADITYQYTFTNGANSSYCITGYKGTMTASIQANSGGIATTACSGHTQVALNCPSGFVQVPGNATYGVSDFCIMKYEARNVSGTATSQPTGTLWVSVTQPQAVTAAATACAGCRLISDAEWMTVAANIVNVPANWVSGTVGSGSMFKGHSDNSPASSQAASADDADGYIGTGNSASSGANQKRTYLLSNGEVIWDLSGNLHEWTSTLTSGAHPGLSSDAALTTKDWNNSGMVWNTFGVNSRPISANASASS